MYISILMTGASDHTTDINEMNSLLTRCASTLFPHVRIGMNNCWGSDWLRGQIDTSYVWQADVLNCRRTFVVNFENHESLYSCFIKLEGYSAREGRRWWRNVLGGVRHMSIFRVRICSRLRVRLRKCSCDRGCQRKYKEVSLANC